MTDPMIRFCNRKSIHFVKTDTLSEVYFSVLHRTIHFRPHINQFLGHILLAPGAQMYSLGRSFHHHESSYPDPSRKVQYAELLVSIISFMSSLQQSNSTVAYIWCASLHLLFLGLLVIKTRKINNRWNRLTGPAIRTNLLHFGLI